MSDADIRLLASVSLKAFSGHSRSLECVTAMADDLSVAIHLERQLYFSTCLWASDGMNSLQRVGTVP